MRHYTIVSFVSLLCLAACLAVPAAAWASYASRIPNGNAVMRNGVAWPGVGHLASGGGGPRNPFGEAFAAAGHQWTVALCGADTDGDGFSNGAELGDPRCVWAPGAQPERSQAISHPGFADSTPSVETSAPPQPTSNVTGLLIDKATFATGTDPLGNHIGAAVWLYTAEAALTAAARAAGYHLMISPPGAPPGTPPFPADLTPASASVFHPLLAAAAPTRDNLTFTVVASSAPGGALDVASAFLWPVPGPQPGSGASSAVAASTQASSATLPSSSARSGDSSSAGPVEVTRLGLLLDTFSTRHGVSPIDGVNVFLSPWLHSANATLAGNAAEAGLVIVSIEDPLRGLPMNGTAFRQTMTLTGDAIAPVVAALETMAPGALGIFLEVTGVLDGAEASPDPSQLPDHITVSRVVSVASRPVPYTVVRPPAPLPSQLGEDAMVRGYLVPAAEVLAGRFFMDREMMTYTEELGSASGDGSGASGPTAEYLFGGLQVSRVLNATTLREYTAADALADDFSSGFVVVSLPSASSPNGGTPTPRGDPWRVWPVTGEGSTAVLQWLQAQDSGTPVEVELTGGVVLAYRAALNATSIELSVTLPTVTIRGVLSDRLSAYAAGGVSPLDGVDMRHDALQHMTSTLTDARAVASGYVILSLGVTNDTAGTGAPWRYVFGDTKWNITSDTAGVVSGLLSSVSEPRTAYVEALGSIVPDGAGSGGPVHQFQLQNIVLIGDVPALPTEEPTPHPTPEPTPVPETPVPATPVPETPAPIATRTRTLDTPAPATPVPETPVPETPAPIATRTRTLDTPAPATPVPETPVPETPAPIATRTRTLDTPAPATPVPETPVPETPAPIATRTRTLDTPAPATPVPETPVPETPAPIATRTRTLDTPAPATPVPETPVPETPAPIATRTRTLDTPAPATPVPETPVPETPAPIATRTRTLDTPAPATPVPETPVPETPAPIATRTRTLDTPAPATPVPETPVPETPAPIATRTRTLDTPAPATPVPETPVPETPAPIATRTRTLDTPAPATPVPETPVPETPAPIATRTRTLDTPAPATPVPETPVPETPAPIATRTRTLDTPAPATPVPETPVPETPAPIATRTRTLDTPAPATPVPETPVPETPAPIATRTRTLDTPAPATPVPETPVPETPAPIATRTRTLDTPAPATPVPETPVPETPAPIATRTRTLDTPAPATPVPETPVPETPAPIATRTRTLDTPAPATPVPETPVPETPAPIATRTRTLDTPAPATPVPETPVPETPAPIATRTRTLDTPAPATPVPETPVPETPAPIATRTRTLDTPAPATPVPETPVPETPAPIATRTRTLDTPAPATPVPETPVPETPAPIATRTRTLDTPAPATPVPETPVPETPAPIATRTRTLDTPAPATPVPETPVPETPAPIATRTPTVHRTFSSTFSEAMTGSESRTAEAGAGGLPDVDGSGANMTNASSAMMSGMNASSSSMGASDTPAPDAASNVTNASSAMVSGMNASSSSAMDTPAPATPAPTTPAPDTPAPVPTAPPTLANFVALLCDRESIDAGVSSTGVDMATNPTANTAGAARSATAAASGYVLLLSPRPPGAYGDMYNVTTASSATVAATLASLSAATDDLSMFVQGTVSRYTSPVPLTGPNDGRVVGEIVIDSAVYVGTYVDTPAPATPVPATSSSQHSSAGSSSVGPSSGKPSFLSASTRSSSSSSAPAPGPDLVRPYGTTKTFTALFYLSDLWSTVHAATVPRAAALLNPGTMLASSLTTTAEAAAASGVDTAAVGLALVRPTATSTASLSGRAAEIDAVPLSQRAAVPVDNTTVLLLNSTVDTAATIATLRSTLAQFTADHSEHTASAALLTSPLMWATVTVYDDAQFVSSLTAPIAHTVAYVKALSILSVAFFDAAVTSPVQFPAASASYNATLQRTLTTTAPSGFNTAAFAYFLSRDLHVPISLVVVSDGSGSARVGATAAVGLPLSQGALSRPLTTLSRASGRRLQQSAQATVTTYFTYTEGNTREKALATRAAASLAALPQSAAPALFGVTAQFTAGGAAPAPRKGSTAPASSSSDGRIIAGLSNLVFFIICGVLLLACCGACVIACACVVMRRRAQRKGTGTGVLSDTDRRRVYQDLDGGSGGAGLPSYDEDKELDELRFMNVAGGAGAAVGGAKSVAQNDVSGAEAQKTVWQGDANDDALGFQTRQAPPRADAAHAAPRGTESDAVEVDLDEAFGEALAADYSDDGRSASDADIVEKDEVHAHHAQGVDTNDDVPSRRFGQTAPSVHVHRDPMGRQTESDGSRSHGGHSETSLGAATSLRDRLRQRRQQGGSPARVSAMSRHGPAQGAVTISMDDDDSDHQAHEYPEYEV